MKKNKILNILMYCLLAALIVVVIVTAIVLNAKRNKLEKLKKANDEIEKKLPPTNGNEQSENKIFFKNIIIFY